MLGFLPNAIYVIFVSLFASVITSFVEWYTIHKTDEHKALKEEVEEEEKQLEKEKKKANKRSAETIKRLEKSITETKAKMGVMGMKSMIFSSVFMLVAFSYLNSTFDGVVVARLPFEPFSLVTMLTQRGLTGARITECSFLFIYALASMIFKTNIQVCRTTVDL